MISTILILVVFGLLMLIAETFLPGWVAGSIGVAVLLLAVILVLSADELGGWSTDKRLLVAGVIIVGSIVSMVVWMRFFGMHLFNRTFTLTAEIATPGSLTEATAMEGREGIAITDLRPLGHADFSGQRHEVRCLAGFADAGTRVRVTGSDPGNLIVVPIAETATNSVKKLDSGASETFDGA
ncbi:MAG: NfeD family protein [Verrucomicrobiaceae bacterium]|nr:NfeD family protein [Verrucomicrobiaceae bacterium]